MQVFIFLVLCTLYGIVKNVIVVRIRAKVGNRARCSGRWCVAKKMIYYSHAVFVQYVYEIHGKR